MKKFKKIVGLTLVEVLIAVVVSSIMMAAMYTSYAMVNNSYTKVIDRASISRSSRDLVGMLVRDIRMAGFKYFDDNLKTENNNVPIQITKSSGTPRCCDKIVIIYGDTDYDTGEKKPTYMRYRITYKARPSEKIIPGTTIKENTFAVIKSKEFWDGTQFTHSGHDRTYFEEEIIDYVEDMVFTPIDEKGDKIDPTDKNRLYDIKLVNINIVYRSPNKFFSKNKSTENTFITSSRDSSFAANDRFLRDVIFVSAYARNIIKQ